MECQRAAGQEPEHIDGPASERPSQPVSQLLCSRIPPENCLWLSALACKPRLQQTDASQCWLPLPAGTSSATRRQVSCGTPAAHLLPTGISTHLLPAGQFPAASCSCTQSRCAAARTQTPLPVPGTLLPCRPACRQVHRDEHHSHDGGPPQGGALPWNPKHARVRACVWLLWRLPYWGTAPGTPGTWAGAAPRQPPGTVRLLPSACVALPCPYCCCCRATASRCPCPSRK